MNERKKNYMNNFGEKKTLTRNSNFQLMTIISLPEFVYGFRVVLISDLVLTAEPHNH